MLNLDPHSRSRDNERQQRQTLRTNRLFLKACSLGILFADLQATKLMPGSKRAKAASVDSLRSEGISGSKFSTIRRGDGPGCAFSLRHNSAILTMKSWALMFSITFPLPAGDRSSLQMTMDASWHPHHALS